jgi:PAS domain S-box-containing protein
MWKWALFTGLTGYLIVHPAVMISGHLMMEEIPDLSLAQVVAHEIKRSFSMGMLPWAIAFALGSAIPGGLYGHMRKMEQVLRTSRVLYQTVVDDQLDYICRFRPDGQCTFVNDSICRLTYRSREELLNQSLLEMAEFGDPSAWRTRVGRLSPENPKTEIEQRLNLPDGTTCWIRWIVIAILDDAGRIAEYQSVGHDITEIKRAQQMLESHQAELERQVQRRTRALYTANENLRLEIEDRIQLEKDIRESELKYRMLFESAPMGIALTTFDGRILAANTKLLSMLKIDGDQLDRIDVPSLYASEEDRARLLAQLQTAHLIEEAEVELRRRDGTTFHAALNLSRFMLEDRDTILAVVNDISMRRQAIQALQRSEADLQELSARLLSVQEAERKRIARELHDSIGQLMHAMKYTVETAVRQLPGNDSAAEARATLDRLMPLVQDAAAENRRIVMDLRPSLLDDLGILATLNWFCREYGKIYNAIAIDKVIRVEESDVPPDLRIVIYRIVQEAFNNIAKHSRATRVRLTFEKNADGLVLTIEDNGVGLGREGDRFNAGFGMSSMRERARTTGGVFELLDNPGQGAGIRVNWPTTHPNGPLGP